MKRTTKMLKRFYYKKLLCWQNENNACTCPVCQTRREKRLTFFLLAFAGVLVWAEWPMLKDAFFHFFK